MFQGFNALRSMRCVRSFRVSKFQCYRPLSGAEALCSRFKVVRDCSKFFKIQYATRVSGC